MSEYTNLGIFTVLARGDSYPTTIVPPSPGEGANVGRLPDGRRWFKNCFLSPDEMRSIVHAEDRGQVEIKTAEEIRSLLSAERVSVRTS